MYFSGGNGVPRNMQGLYYSSPTTKGGGWGRGRGRQHGVRTGPQQPQEVVEEVGTTVHRRRHESLPAVRWTCFERVSGTSGGAYKQPKSYSWGRMGQYLLSISTFDTPTTVLHLHPVRRTKVLSFVFFSSPLSDTFPYLSLTSAPCPPFSLIWGRCCGGRKIPCQLGDAGATGPAELLHLQARWTRAAAERGQCTSRWEPAGPAPCPAARTTLVELLLCPAASLSDGLADRRKRGEHRQTNARSAT